MSDEVFGMAASYADAWQKESALARVAGELRAACTWSCRLSPLVLMTDPARMPDVAAVVQTLPRGAAVIYRHFGKADRVEEARALRELTRARDQQLLIGADPELAQTINADGVHFARDATLAGPRDWREKHPDWIMTMAGLKTGHYAGAFTALDALFVSSVFPSHSPSAGTPMGLAAFRGRAARFPLPVYALGGVDLTNAAQLIGSNAAGLAAIGGLIMNVTKQDTPQGHRFVIATEHGEAELTLARVEDGIFNANHTFTPDALRGKGVAGKLYAAMVVDAKAEGYKVMPGCPYIAAKFKRKPEDAKAIGVSLR